MHAALLAELKDALRDRFTIKEEIGADVYSTIFRATDAHGRLVALKVLRGEIMVAAAPARLLRELTLTARFNHPNVLSILEAGEVLGLVY